MLYSFSTSPTLLNRGTRWGLAGKSVTNTIVVVTFQQKIRDVSSSFVHLTPLLSSKRIQRKLYLHSINATLTLSLALSLFTFRLVQCKAAGWPYRKGIIKPHQVSIVFRTIFQPLKPDLAGIVVKKIVPIPFVGT